MYHVVENGAEVWILHNFDKVSYKFIVFNNEYWLKFSIQSGKIRPSRFLYFNHDGEMSRNPCWNSCVIRREP